MTRVRRPMAVLLSRFPTVSETFVLREVEEMERQGQPVRLVPLLREDPPVVHEEAEPWVERALFTPFLSGPILAANLRALARAPVRWLSLLSELFVGTRSSPLFLLKTLALFPKAVHLGERLEAEGIRHLHAHFATHPATVAMVASSLFDLSFSFTAHAHDIQVNRELLEAKLLRARFARTISAFNREALLRRYPEVDPDVVRVVHVGVDPETYGAVDPEGRTREREREEGTPRLLSVAGLRPYKGLPVLVRACARLRERGVRFRCDVVGEGPMRGELEELIAGLGLEEAVRLRGAVPQGRVPDLLAGADLFVLPSVVQPDGQTEGIPVALMEAMAAGLPVVGSRLSGIPELVEDGVHGRLLVPGDPEALADAVEGLLADPERAAALGREGRRKVERDFSLEACTRALLGAIDAENPPPPEAAVSAVESLPWLAGREAVGVRRLRDGADARVVELLLPGGREAVLKLHRGRPGARGTPAERARREHRALAGLRSGAFGRKLDGDDGGTGGRRDLGVPAPLHLDGERGALVMERAPGGPLLGAIRAARRRPWGGPPAELTGAVRDAGRWLGRLQAATSGPPGSGRTALDALAERARDDLRRLTPMVLGAEEEEALEARVEEAGEGGPVGRATGRHGDFWPGNVLVAPHRLEVVDLEGYGEGHPVEDPWYFLVHLELYHAYPGLRRRGRRLAGLFGEGLGAETEGAALLEEGPLRTLGRTAAAARLLVRAEERRARASSPGGLAARLRRRRVRGGLLRILRGGSA